MKQLLSILAVVALMGCGGKSQSEIVEEAIRASLNRQLLLGQINQILEGAEAEARQIRGNNDLAEEQKRINLEKLRVDSKEQIRKLLLPESDLNKTHFDEVTRLYLGHTQFTDAGFTELAKLEKLSALYLDSTEITDKGLEALLAEKTALEAKLKPVIEQRVKKHQAEISEAKAALETYTNSPAFREAETDKKQKADAAIADANMTLNNVNSGPNPFVSKVTIRRKLVNGILERTRVLAGTGITKWFGIDPATLRMLLTTIMIN